MVARLPTFDPIAAWRHMLIKGQPEQMVRLEAEIERRFLERGWSRDKALEARVNSHPYQRNQFFCWVEGAGHGPRAVLYLNQATPRRLRGGSFALLDDPNGAGYKHVADAVQRALAEVIEPATASVGLSITYPRLGPISRVGPRTEALMTEFATLAEGQWPLPDNLEPEWRRFVAGLYRDDVAFEPGELESWLVANGWDAPGAAALMRRFFADAALLAAYDEAEEQPA